MKTSRLQEIINIIEQTNINVLQVEEDNFKLYYQKNEATPSGEKMLSEETNTFNTYEEESDLSEDIQTTEESNDIKEITSPMIGTFYMRPEPEADAHVKVGSTVSIGDSVCVLEAMKLLNEVTSDVNGEILEVLVKDGDVIEYGQPLFKVRVGE